MLKGKQIIFIGKFEEYKHISLKKIVQYQEGKTVLNCSKNTNFIIVPNNIKSNLKKYQTNQQIISAKRRNIPIYHLNYLFSLINQLIHSSSEFIVKELSNHDKLTLSQQCPKFESYAWGGKLYLYNTITGLCKWNDQNYCS